MTTGTAVLAVVLVAVNVWVHVGPSRTHLVTGPLAALVLLVVGRLEGLTWEQLGLGLEQLPAGLVVGLAGAAVIAVVISLGLVLPVTRTAFLDTRYDVDGRTALRTALITIPLSTVVFEETAFRAVVWGLLERASGGAAATLVSSALFGVWHVLPALDVVVTSAALRGRTTGRGGRAGVRVLVVLGAVAGTALAGVALAGLRWWTGSLIAPVLVHAAANGCAVLASSRAWARLRASGGSSALA